jgi:hypothetical protein
MEDNYRIRVQGHLGDCWSDWFGGLTIECQDDGSTMLRGPVGDQAALHGLIARIRDLELPLLSIDQRREPEEPP